MSKHAAECLRDRAMKHFTQLIWNIQMKLVEENKRFFFFPTVTSRHNWKHTQLTQQGLYVSTQCKLFFFSYFGSQV